MLSQCTHVYFLVLCVGTCVCIRVCVRARVRVCYPKKNVWGTTVVSKQYQVETIQPNKLVFRNKISI